MVSVAGSAEMMVRRVEMLRPGLAQGGPMLGGMFFGQEAVVTVVTAADDGTGRTAMYSGTDVSAAHSREHVSEKPKTGRALSGAPAF